MTAAKLERDAERPERLVLRSPHVGLWRGAPPVGSLLGPGASLGAVEVLGVLHPVTVPEGAVGRVVELAPPEQARRPIDHGALLCVLDASAAGAATVEASATAAAAASSARVFRAPMSGRFFLRPAPDKPAFVAVGDSIETGRTVGLLEVMKTFNRVHFGGEGLPSPAVVARVVPADGDEVMAGDPLLELE
jgi:acetyl-CoA carboxylase biotin carboxyl carrier protein